MSDAIEAKCDEVEGSRSVDLNQQYGSRDERRRDELGGEACMARLRHKQDGGG